MKGSLDFMKLDSWKQAHLLALDVFDRSKNMAKRQRGHLGADLCNSALAIPARIARASAMLENADVRETLESAILSAREVQVQLMVARDLGCLPAGEADRLIQRAEEVRNLIWKQMPKKSKTGNA
jgi:four helix bundle protein